MVTRNAFQLEIGFTDDVAVIAEAGLRLTTAGGHIHDYAAGNTADLAVMMRLVGTSLNRALVSSSGLLSLGFDNGDRVAMSADRDVEGWNICDGEGVRVVCRPGGGLTHVPALELDDAWPFPARFGRR